MFPVPDGGAHRADQSHHQQDAEQNQDLHVGHPLHVGALQRRLGGVLERRSLSATRVEVENGDVVRRNKSHLHQFGVVAGVDDNSHNPLGVSELGTTQQHLVWT